MSETTFTPSVAVVDHVDEQFIVWHVNIGSDLSLSRMAGAWVLGVDEVDVLTNLTVERHIAFASRSALPKGLSPAGFIDLDRTVEHARSEIVAADRLFTDHQLTVPHSLVRPDWPPMRHPERSQRLPSTLAEHLVPALSLAYGLRDLADAWAKFEALRITRDYLIPHGGPSARPLPLEVR
ncbi:hypothetical protein ACFXO9_34715 [Nocardia tengchongensis]|uniref:hypothetical protein n=1 Tax=Nocardia tengchongensis TaxID=2055889 RepID=UPI003699F48F